MILLLRRYAEYSAAIVGINETFPHEQMHKLLAFLQVILCVWNARHFYFRHFHYSYIIELMQMNENEWKCMKINEMCENVWKCMEMYENESFEFAALQKIRSAEIFSNADSCGMLILAL